MRFLLILALCILCGYVAVGNSATRLEEQGREEGAGNASVGFNDLRQYVQGSGGVVGPVNIVYSDVCGGRDVITTRDIEAGELVFSIPWSTILVPLEMDHPFLRKISSHPAATKLVISAMTILIEKTMERRSSHAPYLRSLPSKGATPLAWSPALQDAIRAHPTLQGPFERLENELMDGWSLIYEMLPLFPHLHRRISQNDFEWAFSMVQSRGFQLPRPGKPSESIGALVPFADMCNCGSGGKEIAQWKVATLPKQGWTLRASQAIRAGTSIRLDYGENVSIWRLLDYGFVPADFDVETEWIPLPFVWSNRSYQFSLSLGDMRGSFEQSLFAQWQALIVGDTSHDGDGSSLNRMHPQFVDYLQKVVANVSRSHRQDLLVAKDDLVVEGVDSPCERYLYAMIMTYHQRVQYFIQSLQDFIALHAPKG
jgi:hypothetical protein